MATVNSRTAPQRPIAQQEASKSWLRRAFEAVQEAVSGPQIGTQTGTRGPDTYSDAGRRDLNAPRSLRKLCNTGKGDNMQVLKAISNAHYFELLDEISNYSETPTSAPTRRT